MKFIVTWPDGTKDTYQAESKEALIATHWGSTPVPKTVTIEAVKGK